MSLSQKNPIKETMFCRGELDYTAIVYVSELLVDKFKGYN